MVELGYTVVLETIGFGRASSSLATPLYFGEMAESGLTRLGSNPSLSFSWLYMGCFSLIPLKEYLDDKEST